MTHALTLPRVRQWPPVLPVLADPIGLRKALQDGMAAANQAGVGEPKLAPGLEGAPSPATL